ncbi:MAG TPA: 4-oxalocrotonate tautomerase [Bacillus bacterium]|nr:4-oxalocrotonate tautomerase [Bacillus sp. (in: firmicutes)]
MPIITIKLARGRTVKVKQKFVEAVTKEAVHTLNVKAEWVTVLFDEYDRENWASKGELHSLKFGKEFGEKGTE